MTYWFTLWETGYLVYKNLPTDLKTTSLKHWLSHRPTNMYVVRPNLSSELIFCSAPSSVFAEHTIACMFSPKSSQFDHNPCRSNVCNILKICPIYLWSKLIRSSQLHSVFPVVSIYVHFPTFRISPLSLDSIHAGWSSNIHWCLACL